MRLVIDGAQKPRTLNDSAMTVPKSIYASKILAERIELEPCTVESGIGHSLMQSLHQQHPIINTWLLLSSVSICFLSALFFVLPQ